MPLIATNVPTLDLDGKCLNCLSGEKLPITSDGVSPMPPSTIFIPNFDDRERFNLNMNQAMPETDNGRPVYGDDGSLTFPEDKDPPAYVTGFTQDVKDPRVFHSRWPECVRRATCVAAHEGRVEITALCNNGQSEHFFEPVTADVRATCQVCHQYRKRVTLPRTADGCVARVEEKARDWMKARLGDDIFERAEGNLAAWRANRNAAPVATITKEQEHA